MKVRSGLALTLVIVGLFSLAATSYVYASSDSISQAFYSNVQLKNGDIVSLEPANQGYIEPSDVNNGARLIGVVVGAGESLLAANNGTATNQVATSGSVSTLVSTVNGNISTGDQIAVSPFEGVGMKASPGSHVVGLAQGNFSSSSNDAQSLSVADKSGAKHNIYAGYIPLDISVTVASAAKSADSLTSLQKTVYSWTGKKVATTKLIASAIIGFVAVITLLALVYGSIYSSIVSVGRNPLAKHAIFQSLSSVIAMALIVSGLATAIIAYLLK